MSVKDARVVSNINSKISSFSNLDTSNSVFSEITVSAASFSNLDTSNSVFSEITVSISSFSNLNTSNLAVAYSSPSGRGYLSLDINSNTKISFSGKTMNSSSLTMRGKNIEIRGKVSSYIKAIRFLKGGSKKFNINTKVNVLKPELISSLYVEIEPDYNNEFRLIHHYSIKPELELSFDYESRLIFHYNIKPLAETSIEKEFSFMNGFGIFPSVDIDYTIDRMSFRIEPLIAFERFYDYLLKLLPERYRRNEDFSVFINSLAREFGRIKDYAERLPLNQDPYRADDNFLSYLAERIGYRNFDSRVDDKHNREILANWLNIQKRKASPRIIKAAVKFAGRPEDLLYKEEDLEDIFITFVDIGIYEVLYLDSDLLPKKEHIEDVRQAGVKVLFAFVPLIIMADYGNELEFQMVLNIFKRLSRETTDIKLNMEIEQFLDVLRHPYIWGSPVYELDDIIDSEIKSQLVQQPDFEVHFEDIIT